MTINEEYMELLLKETNFYNGLVLPQGLRDLIPHFVQTWLRNCIFSIIVYSIVTLLCVNFWRRHFSKESMKTIASQISLASKAIPLGLSLHSGMEYMVVKGWTKCYPRLSDVGLGAYLYHLILYLAFLEFTTYWAHRIHHDIAPMYKYVHRAHHLYRKEDTLTPFAGFAMHPLEAIMMGLPHAIAIVIIPIHYTTHVALLLIQSVWAIIIHDRSPFINYWPIMSAQYHTIHHTSGHYNFGNFTIWMDQLFGTLRRPIVCIDGSKEE